MRELPLRPAGRHVTFAELAEVPQDRRRFGWVVVHLVRDRARRQSPTWRPLCVIGFFSSRDAALESIGTKRQAGYKFEVCPFDDGSPVDR